MIYRMAFAFMLLASIDPLFAQQWHTDDDTFDPSLKSVVIGDRSWIGDPSPFELVGSDRTGYTYTQAAAWEGFDPSINISLMVPMIAGEMKMPGGGTLMLDKDQVKVFVKSVRKTLEHSGDLDAKPIELDSAMGAGLWSLQLADDQNERAMIDLRNTQKDKVEVYRFSANAMKKLLGAVEHSLKSLVVKGGQEE